MPTIKDCHEYREEGYNNAIADLRNCETLVCVEGTVYRLSKIEYGKFTEAMNIVRRLASDIDDTKFREALEYVESVGERICSLEVYQY